MQSLLLHRPNTRIIIIIINDTNMQQLNQHRCLLTIRRRVNGSVSNETGATLDPTVIGGGARVTGAMTTTDRSSNS